VTKSKSKRALTDLALLVAMFVAIAGHGLLALSQTADAAQQSTLPIPIPPRVAEARRFLAQRGWAANRDRVKNASLRAGALISRQIAEAVRIGPYLMPKFSRKAISDRQLESIIAYLESAKKPHDRGGWGIGHIGPVPEGMVAWFIAAFVLVGLCGLIGERLRA